MSKPIIPYWVAGIGALIVLSGVADVVRRRSRPSRVASKLYGLIVTQARAPALYRHAGVPDTTEGRFEAIVLYTVLVLDRLLAEGADGARLARALVEALIADMDDQMREMGVGDLSVPKRVKKAAGAVYDRLAAYRPSLVAGDLQALAEAFSAARLTTDGHAPPAGWPSLAAHALAVRHDLAAAPRRALLDGALEFPEYREQPDVALTGGADGA